MTPEENFFTESLRFILTLDKKLCGSFVKFIGNGKEFVPLFEIKSQVQYGNSIIDLEITDKTGKKIFIEVKIKAQENRYFSEDGKEDFGQVEKYLRLNHGYVCFIAQEQNDVEIKTNKDKFLGQFEWFQIYELFDNYIKTDKCDNLTDYFLTNFLKFMEELGMQPFQGFNKNDIKLSQTNFLDLYVKLLDFLRCVKKDRRVINFCKRNKLITPQGQPTFYDYWGSFTLSFGRKRWRKVPIEIGFCYLENSNNDLQENPKNGIYYYAGIWLAREKVLKIRNKIKNFNLNKKYFTENKKSLAFQSMDNNNLVFSEIYFQEFIKQGEKKAIDFICESLLELEKKGVIKAIEEIM